MRYEMETMTAEAGEAIEATAAVGAPFPVGIAIVEQTAGALRAYLLANGLGDYQIFHCPAHGAADLDEYLAELDEDAAWEPLRPATAGGEAVRVAVLDEGEGHAVDCGILRLRRLDLVLARRFWSDNGAGVFQLWLWAAPSADRLSQLGRRLESMRHARGAAVWQIVRGGPHDVERIPRDPAAAEGLLLPHAIRRKLEVDIVRFFSDAVVRMYQGLGVPHRRGVLLHGPPGNGKTSLIRAIGAALPRIPVMLLRPVGNFQTRNLEIVLDRWRRQAPCILVIEDLNWLLGSVNVSTFLNLIDGVETNLTGGLMLIATSNYPDRLDPAINNRPGRFDVVIEVPCPTRDLRLEFFRQKLPCADASLVGRLADATERLSFAHLQEILRLSGLLAIHADRTERTDDDLIEAAADVSHASEQAADGFVPQPETPFGLTARRR